MMTKTQQEIVRQGYQALVNSPGQGDYSQERPERLDRISLQDILILMKQHREEDPDRYDEIIE